MLKGNQCKECGWVGNIAGFCFHHPDPTQKEFGLSTAPTTNWEKYWEEAKKCDLLCVRCHTILHADNSDEQFLKDVESYKGRALIASDIPWKNQTRVPKVYIHTCPNCQQKYETSIKQQRFCSLKCRNENSRKCQRPTKEELQKMISEMPMLHIGKKYGVTDNAVRKWCKGYGIQI